MAVVSSVGPWLIRKLQGITAVEDSTTATYKNPMKGQWNMPGRLAGWEDTSLARILALPVTTTGTVTACEVTIFQKSAARFPGLPVGTLVLDVDSKLFKPQPLKLGPIRAGGFAAVVTKLTGTTPNVSFELYLEGYSEDEA